MLILDLAQGFQREKIPYAVVGGFAVALHGAVRGTVDVDLILKLQENDFVAAESLLKKMGFESRLPVSAKEVFQFREEYSRNRNLIAWSFYDPKNPARQVDIIITQDLNDIDTVIKKLKGIPIRVISIQSLIHMKQKSGRPQDLADVSALTELLNEKE